MAKAIQISASCTVNNNTIRKNGDVIFTSAASDVEAFLVEAYKHFNVSYNRFYKMDNLSKLGWLTTELLLTDNFDKDNYGPAEVGMVLANANSSLDSDLKYIASVADIPSPALFVYTLPNIMIGEISIRNNFKGEAAFFIAEKFDAVFIEQYVTNLFDNDILKACICGWVDLLGNDYKATLFLVEQGSTAMPFTADNMNKVFDNE